jgi:enoyl-CoA hydratase
MELALSCDLIVANSSCQSSASPKPSAAWPLQRWRPLIKLPRQIPPRIAMELALTGDFIDGEARL